MELYLEEGLNVVLIIDKAERAYYLVYESTS